MNKAKNLRKGRVSLPNHYYAITISTHNRIKHFVNLTINQPLATAIYDLENTKLIKIVAYVIMPDHIHLLFQLLDGATLPHVIRRFKGRTTSLLRPFLSTKLWQKGYFDRCIRDEEELINQARYIVSNPLREGLCTHIIQYPYWNCIYLTQSIKTNAK